jgi:hypothetical protein
MGAQEKARVADLSLDVRADPTTDAAEADAELREALRLARGACELLDRAAPASGARGHSIRIAQAISESLVTELEMVTGRGAALSTRAKRLT